MTERIPIHISNHRAYIWDPDDAATLRSEHHITGQLTGTLPSLAQQNVFLGLPLILLPEEVVYLVENCVCSLLDNANGHKAPTENELSEWKLATKEHRLESINALESIRKEKEALQSENISDEARRKRQEREAKRSKSSRELDETVVVDNAEMRLPRKDKEAAYTIIIPGTAADHPWFKPPVYECIPAAREAGVWTYPDTPMERAKCAVFADLLRKGYFLGPGLKFGGDWLVYPGDQMRYHSHFVASVLLTSTSKLTPMEIVAHGRLGTVTKKVHLLCGWEEATGAIDYYSIEWAYFG